jgi:hypothetical protein
MQNTMNSRSARASLAAPSARRRLVLPLAALACILASGSAALAQEAPGCSAEQPGAELDEELQFLLDNGFETFFFAQTCRSIGPDGDVIEGDSLPVGNGRELECETAPVTFLQAIDASSSTGERFCALGQLSSVSGENIDKRLSVDVVSIPDGAPWVLVGTSEEAITIGRVGGFAGGTAFPLAADALFDVIDLQPNPTGDLCEIVFDL